MGTWQAERKPIHLKTKCEFIPTKGKETEKASTDLTKLENSHAEAVKKDDSIIHDAKNNKSDMKTPVLVESPDHTPRECNTASTNIETAPDNMEIKSTHTSKSNTPQGSRPESRMAHQNIQSPLGFRPASTISEVS